MTTELRRVLVYRAAQALAAPFTLEELCVASWRQSPETFRMREFPQYPDFHRFRGVVDGRLGMIACGYLIRVDGKFRAGKDPLATNDGPADRLEVTVAARKYAAGQQSTITRNEAWAFWDIPRGEVSPEEVREALNAVENLLRPRDTPQQRELWNCHEWLKERFGVYIRIYQTRATA